MKRFFFLSIASFFSMVQCFAQPFTFDPTFGLGGKVYTNILDLNRADEAVKAMAIQPDGKILIVGSTRSPAALVRYNLNGTLDNSFDGDGMAFCFGLKGNAIAIQSDGKIVVAGYSGSANTFDFALARFNANGRLDNSFGVDGRLITSIGAGDDVINYLAIQSDGKIVVAGYSYNGVNNDMVLIRYNSDGTLDNSFDGDGKLIANFALNAIVIQSDGKIVVAGASNGDFALARYNTNGSPDNSFDEDGRLTTEFGSTIDVATSVVVQSDGKIVAGGSSYNGSNNDFALCRYNTDGSLDNSFDGDGKHLSDIGMNSHDLIKCLAIQNDGKIVAAGQSAYAFGLARYNVDGNLDNSFDGDGILTTHINSYDFLTSLVIQSDGKIVTAGRTEGAGSFDDFTLIRYNTNGSLDNSFDADGKVITGISSSFDVPGSFAIQNDGKIVLAGYGGRVEIGHENKISVVRYNTDGSMDNSFDGDGKVITERGPSTDDVAAAVAIQSDGRILILGSTDGSASRDFLIARYNLDGTLDNSFDSDGIITVAFGVHAYGTCLAIQSDGKIVAAGHGGGGNTYDFVVARFNTDGSLDNSFSGDGKMKISLSSFNDMVWSVAIQDDGKILLAGNSGAGYNVDFAIVRCNSDGTLDNSFDGDGILIADISSSIDYLHSMCIQSDGKVLIGGSSKIGEDNTYLVLARYNADGTLDDSFDGDGKMIGPLGSAATIALQNNGKILVGGSGSLFRYNTDGSTDNTFDGDGRALLDQTNSNVQDIGFIRLYGNRIYVSGGTSTAGNSDFGMAAIVNDVLNSPLPLRLLDFSGKRINEDAQLTWKTELESDMLEYVVERSIDGRNYSDVGVVAAANRTPIHNYYFTDYNITSLNAPVMYYRLRQKSIDGKHTYSRIIALSLDKNKNIVLFYPNPVINEINLALTANRPDKLQVRIMDNTGRIMKQQKWNVSAGSTSLSLDVTNLAKGVYYLEIKGESIDYKKQFVK